MVKTCLSKVPSFSQAGNSGRTVSYLMAQATVDMKPTDPIGEIMCIWRHYMRASA
jgi:hypothetical protein